MNNKLPKVFQNKIDKQINNNSKFFYSANNNIENKEKKGIIDVRKKINDIFSSSNYVYKAEVLIKTDENEIDTKIIGRNKNYLITMNNKTIPIDIIRDINIKKN